MKLKLMLFNAGSQGLCEKLVVFLFLSFFVTSSGVCQEAFVNFGNLKSTNANIAFFGDLRNNGTFTNNTGSLYFAGSTLQTIDGSSIIQGEDVFVNNSSNIKVDNELQVSNSMTFQQGKVLSDRADFNTEFVHFLDNSTYSGLNNTRHVDGVVRKTGEEAFVFPVGDNDDVQTISKSQSGTESDVYTAYYLQENVNPIYSTSAIDVTGCYTTTSVVSECEYWRLDHSVGVASTVVGLSWDANSCGINDACELVVSRWFGTEWGSEGNGGVTGTLADGGILSGNGCQVCGTPVNTSGFGFFTLGTISPVNLLPVELFEFEASQTSEKEIVLNWSTASELNSSHFSVERSYDLVNWEKIGEVAAMGNSNSLTSYTFPDRDFNGQVMYYRLQMFDINYDFEFSDVRSVKVETSGFDLFPVPAKDFLTLNSQKRKIESVLIFDMTGAAKLHLSDIDSYSYTINTSSFESGVYLIRTEMKDGGQIIKKIVKK